jgi:hypothetical protein
MICEALGRDGGGRRGFGAGRHVVHVRALGRAVQVDPIKPTLKAPGIKLVKLKHGEPLSNFAFKFKLSLYNSDDFRDAVERTVPELGRQLRLNGRA